MSPKLMATVHVRTSQRAQTAGRNRYTGEPCRNLAPITSFFVGEWEAKGRICVEVFPVDTPTPSKILGEVIGRF
jgi:hypothetical protein